jgi:hypothetical protein
MTQRPTLTRLLLLPIVAFTLALAAQGALRVAGVPAANPLAVVITPIIAAGVVYAGLRSYPTAGRLRMAAMVAVGLIAIGLAT